MHAEQHDRVGDQEPRKRRPLLFAALVLAVLFAIAVGLFAALRSTTPVQQVQVPGTEAEGVSATTPNTHAPQPPAATAPPAVTVATPHEQSPAPPLPALEHSDPEVRATLADVLPAIAQGVLAPDELLRRVATLVANFGRGKLLRDKLPLPVPGGKLAVTERDGALYLAPANYERYNALADALAGVDTDALARWFDRYEPLLAEAWKELGADDGDVRGAAIAGLDVLLAAPELEGEIPLVQPAVFYKYADPALESLPDTQKLLIRIGPDNRRLVKDRARRLRDALATP